MSEQILSVEKTMNVLDLFLEYESLGVKQISDLTGYSKSSVHRILTTLEASKYLFQEKEHSNYMLTSKLYYLGQNTAVNKHLVNACVDAINELLGKISHTISISIREDTSTVTIYEAHEKQNLTLVPKIGSSRSVHVSAAGKVLTAFAKSKDEIASKIDYVKFTDYTIQNKSDFDKELEEVYSLGYACDDEELTLGLFCVAVPVFDKKGLIVCSISVSAFKSNILADFDKIKDAMIYASKQITNKL